jgi:hypothetical protein
MELRAAQNVMLPVSATSSDGRFDIASFAINVGTRQAGVAVADARSGDGGNKHAEAVDVYLDGVRIADDLAPGAATAFLPVTLISTTPRIDLVDAAAPDNSAPLASFTADLFGPSADTLAFSEQTMLLLADTPGDTLGLVVKHHARTEAEDATEADVFFVHASPDAPRLLARLRSVQEALPPLAFGETSAYQPVKPGVYLVDVSDADTGTLLDTFRLDLTASAGQAVALVLTGRRADGTFTLDAVDAAGADVPSPVEEAALPLHFTLHGNYPNPFNPTTTIRFDLPEPALVHVEVFDVLGRRVLVLPSQPTLAGAAQERALDAAALASGLYFYRVTATASTRTYQQTGRMMLLK